MTGLCERRRQLKAVAGQFSPSPAEAGHYEGDNARGTSRPYRLAIVRGKRGAPGPASRHDQEFYQLLDKDGITDDIHIFRERLRNGGAL